MLEKWLKMRIKIKRSDSRGYSWRLKGTNLSKEHA
jgi:hypothetical protein